MKYRSLPLARTVLAVLVAVVCAAEAWAALPAPIAYWSFDNDPDRQINDLTGNSNAGVWFDAGPLSPGFDADVPSQIGSGRSLLFDDAGDARTNQQYVALDMSFSGTGALPQMTASAWFRTSFSGPPTGPTAQEFNWAIIDFDRSEYFDLYVRDTDGAIGFSTNHGGAAANVHDMVGNTTGLNDGDWHHVLAVYDGTDKRLYVDGLPDGTASNPHGGNPLGSTLPRFGYVGDGSEATQFNDGIEGSGAGADNGRNDFYYDGRIDDVAVWDVALSAGDIAALYAGTSPAEGLAPLPTLAPGAYTIDFESLAAVPENSVISNRISGMTFDGATLVFPGGSPAFGFGSAFGNDTPKSGEPAGGAMITDISDVNASPNPVGGSPFSPITVTWNGMAVEDLTFQVVDIDGGHVFTARVYDAVEGGNLLHTLVVNDGDPDTGDGIATPIDFGGYTDIRRLEIVMFNSGGVSGFAADNFSFTVLPAGPIIIPEPSTQVVWSLLAGLGIGVGCRRRRR